MKWTGKDFRRVPGNAFSPTHIKQQDIDVQELHIQMLPFIT